MARGRPRVFDEPMTNTQAMRWKRYKVSPREYAELLRVQEGKCWICGSTGALGLDHNHKTGDARGLLCRDCNLGLGFFKDNRSLLDRAGKYLGKFY